MGVLYKRAAKARPAAPKRMGAAVCMAAPESPEEVPEALESESSELELEPLPEPPVEAAFWAEEAAEPPAETADWLTSEPSYKV